MNNAEKFQETFGIYATEMWAMPESDFLNWLNSLHDAKASNTTDLISRQDAIKALQNMPTAEALKAISEMPSAERKGKWLVSFPYSSDNSIRECSVCHVTQSVNLYKGEVRFKFCPYCGADMRGEENGM